MSPLCPPSKTAGLTAYSAIELALRALAVVVLASACSDPPGNPCIIGFSPVSPGGPCAPDPNDPRLEDSGRRDAGRDLGADTLVAVDARADTAVDMAPPGPSFGDRIFESSGAAEDLLVDEDGLTLASAFLVQRISRDGLVMAEYRGGGRVHALSAQGERLAVAGQGYVALLDRTTLEPIAEMARVGGLRCFELQLAVDGRVFCDTGRDELLWLDPAAGTEVAFTLPFNVFTEDLFVVDDANWFAVSSTGVAAYMLRPTAEGLDVVGESGYDSAPDDEPFALALGAMPVGELPPGTPWDGVLVGANGRMFAVGANACIDSGRCMRAFGNVGTLPATTARHLATDTDDRGRFYGLIDPLFASPGAACRAGCTLNVVDLATRDVLHTSIHPSSVSRVVALRADRWSDATLVLVENTDAESGFQHEVRRIPL